MHNSQERGSSGSSWHYRCAFLRPEVLAALVSLLTLVFLLLVGDSQETVLRCDAAGLCAGGGVVLVASAAVIAQPQKWGSSFFLRSLFRALLLASFVFLYFGLTSFSPIFAVQALTTLAALTFSASTCTFLACTLETRGELPRNPRGRRLSLKHVALGYLCSIGSWLLAYSVLLLHQEVDGHLAGLSRSLSREEHLVLFSFGGFFLSTVVGFLLLLLPCGHHCLGGTEKVKPEETPVICRCNSKADDSIGIGEQVQAPPATAMQAMPSVGCREDAAQVPETPPPVEHRKPDEQLEVEASCPSFEVDAIPAADVVEAVQAVQKEVVPATTPATGAETAGGAFPFPRGPSRPRRRCGEAWTAEEAPKKRKAKARGLTAVLEVDEDEGAEEEEQIEEEQILEVEGQDQSGAQAVSDAEQNSNAQLCLAANATSADGPQQPECKLEEVGGTDAALPCQEGLMPPSQERRCSSEEKPPSAQRLVPLQCQSLRGRTLEICRAAGMGKVGLPELRRAVLVSLAGHIVAGLLLLLAGHMVIVALSLLFIKLCFLAVRLSASPTASATKIAQCPSPEISVTPAASRGSSSPLANVPESYAASWGFFPPDRGLLREHGNQPGRLGVGVMPAVAEEDVAADPMMALSTPPMSSWPEESGSVDRSPKPAAEGLARGTAGSDHSSKLPMSGRPGDSAFFRPAGRRGGRPGADIESFQSVPLPAAFPAAECAEKVPQTNGNQTHVQEPEANETEGPLAPGLPQAAGSQKSTSSSVRISMEHFPSPRASSHLSIPAFPDPGISEDSSSTAGSCTDGKQSARARAIAQSACRWLRQGCWDTLIGMSTIAALVSFTLGQAIVILFVFIFDLVFIEKYATSSLSRHFMLAAENATCLSSRRLTALTGDMLPSECAREVVRSTSLAAFSMGPPNSVGLRACYPQDGLEELSYADVFYGTDDAICEWMENPSFDFFVIEKQQPCSILGRGTSLIISNATAFSHRVSDDLQRALSSYCSPCGDLVLGTVEVARKMLMVDVLVHRSLASASPGLRRIAAASMALGSAFAVLLLTLLDAFSFVSLALEMLRLRSIGFVGSPLHFAFVVTIGQAVEQLGLLVLHSLIMAGMSFQLELANDFWPELHCTRSAMSPESVPNAWHQAARWTGTTLVFFAAGISVFFALCILGGYAYRFHGLVPAGWLASLLYSRDVKMTRFAAAPLSMSDYRHETLAVDPAEAETISTSLLRPGLGVLASLGFWHQKMSYVFQVGRRLEWYLPALPDTDPMTTAFTSDCVSWMAVVRATVHNLSIAWLLLPFGALPARACLYLNERILFATGTDGGNSADEADALMQHALEDVGIFWQTSGWLAAMGHFVTLLLLLAVDFLILPHDPREQLIAGLLATGAVLAVLRAAVAQIQGLESCRHRHGLVAACSEILQDALPSRVVQSHTRAQLKTHPRSRSEEQADALGIRPWHAGLPFAKVAASHRHEKLTPLPVRRGACEPTDEECLSALRGDAERVVSACRELLELDWVRSGLLPGRLRGKLVAARAARNRRIRLAQALLASRRPGFLARLRRRPAASSGLFYGALLMALREVAEEDLIAQRCASEARNVVCEHLRQHCTLQARKLQLWLHGTARSQAARWAQALSLSGAVGDILEGLDSREVCKPCDGEVASESEEPAEPGADAPVATADQQVVWVQPATEENSQNQEEADDVLVSQDEDQELGPRQQRLHAFLQSPGLPEESEAGVASATASATLPFDPATVRARATLQPQAWESRDAPQTLRMLFAVSQQGLIRISGHWAAGGREVLPEKQARVNITAKAEVVLHWPKSARPSSANVQVEFISHQIWPPLPRKPAAAGAGGLLTKRSDTRLRTPCRRRLGSSWAQQNDELRWWERQVAGRGWLLRRSPAAVSNMPNEEDRMDSLWRILCGVEWSACPDGQSSIGRDEDSEGAVVLPTELGQTRWLAPVALPALDASQQEKFRPRCHSTASGDLFQTAGRKLASTQVGGCVGLLGPVAHVMQEPVAMDDEVLFAAKQAAAVAASAAAQAPRAALRALEVAMRRNPQQLGAAFLTSLYAGTGGLSQVEVVRRSWLMAAAARKLLKQKRARQAQQERSQFDAGLRMLSEQLLFWTASRERKRWLRTSEREPMGLTFLGKSQAPNWGILDVGSSSTSPAKSAKSGLDAALEMAEPQDMDASFCSMARGSSGEKWLDSEDMRRRRTSRRSSQGSASGSGSGDRVTPFQCNAATPTMVVTEVDDFDPNLVPRFRGSEPENATMDEAQMQEGSRHIQQMVADFVLKASSHQADVAELEKTLEEARQGAVGSADQTTMQKAFGHLMALQRAALGLLESLQSGSIRQLESRLSMARELGLAPDAFPDAAGDGLLKLAAQKLEEQKAAAPGFLDTALDAFASHSSKKGVLGVGVIALQRCVDQARAAKIQDSTKLHRVEAKLHLLCERKREIALLKAAMAAEDAWLLKAATEECRQRFGEVTFGVDLTLAKCQLEIWERASSAQAAVVSTTSEARRPSSLRLASRATSSEPVDLERSDVLAPLALGTPVVSTSSAPPVPAQEERAVIALRAAMFQEPPQAGLLRLAIARARRAGVAKEEVSKAEAVLQEEREAEQALEQLRRAAAARDVRALRRAIADCADAGVDQGRLLPASTQLCDALGELLKRAHQHGLALSVLTDLDRERQELRYSLAEKRSGLRTVCRVRPPLAPELQTALRSHAGLAPVLRRVDRRTLEVALASGTYATCDFSAVLGPESTQAEVSTELLGLAQAAIDGGNVAVIACGQRGAGKSFTLCGSADQPGVLPHLLEELFAIKSREHWRSDIHIDVQALEIVDDGPPTDLLSQASEGETVEERIEAIRPCCVQGGPGQLLAASAAILSGAATRRAARLQ
ncbi:KIN14Q, partial [Symbiodinium sp. CCMP2456]